jgi:hypothetical protein
VVGEEWRRRSRKEIEEGRWARVAADCVYFLSEGGGGFLGVCVYRGAVGPPDRRIS